jgi:hypothetical protein
MTTTTGGGGSCKLNFKLSRMTVDTILKELNKNYEVSGIVKFSNNGNDSKIVNKNNGSSDSVSTPNHIVNFHTHPVSAYRNADTVWGWPSGEDIRETMKFGLAGNKAHIVFTVEGLYTIQLNKCKLRKMKTLLTDTERGILIFLIEEYFKATHNLRGTDELNKLHKKGIIINPESYCNFVNHFDLGCLLISSKTKHTSLPIQVNFSRLPNNGFLEFDEFIYTLPISTYITDLDEIYKINESGIEMGKVKIKNNKLLLEQAKIIIKKLGIKKCTDVWNNSTGKWFYINFFPSDYYLNKEYLDSDKFIKPLKETIVNLNSTGYEPFIKLYSNNTDGCSIETMERNNNFNNKINKSKSTFGNGGLNPQERYQFYKNLITTDGTFFNDSLFSEKIKNEIYHLIKLGILNYHNGYYILNTRILSK